MMITNSNDDADDVVNRDVTAILLCSKHFDIYVNCCFCLQLQMLINWSAGDDWFGVGGVVGWCRGSHISSGV